MEYRLGNYKKVKSIGETEEVTCPKCNNKVNMSLFSNGEFRLQADFPLFRTGNVFFLVCPHCSAIYGVDESKADNFVKGEKLSIGNYDLKELNGFNV
ncbi:MAG: hypothetical protein ACI4IN_02595 [Eubacterium sp.]